MAFRQALVYKNNSTTTLIINILYQPMLLDWLSKYFADPFLFNVNATSHIAFSGKSNSLSAQKYVCYIIHRICDGQHFKIKIEWRLKNANFWALLLKPDTRSKVSYYCRKTYCSVINYIRYSLFLCHYYIDYRNESSIR